MSRQQWMFAGIALTVFGFAGGCGGGSSGGTDTGSGSEGDDTGTEEYDAGCTDGEIQVDASMNSCADVESQFTDVLEKTKGCSRNEDCRTMYGQCGWGLWVGGGCYDCVNHCVDQGQLDVFGKTYSDLGCTQGVCDCDNPPEAECVNKECTCVGSNAGTKG
jgi:hypothetical protein